MNELTLDITDYGTDGVGIAHLDNITYFIKNALVGENVTIKNIKKNKNIIFCEADKIIKKSPNRVAPICKYYYACGGCNLQCLNINEQLKYKQILLRNSLKKFIKNELIIQPIIHKQDYNYRNKIVLAVREKNGQKIIGMFIENTRDIVPIDICYLNENLTSKLIKCTKMFLEKSSISCYNENTKNGQLKYVVAREIDGKVLVCVVDSGKNATIYQQFYEILKKEFIEVGLSLCQNNKDSEILGGKFIYINGIKEIKAHNFGINYTINIASFMQINNLVANEIYTNIFNVINQKELVINCYSGAGLLSAYLAKYCYACIGIEYNKSATRLAQNLAKNNVLNNLYNLCGKCEDTLPQILTNVNNDFVTIKTKIDEIKLPLSNKEIVCVLDPPRSGCKVEVLQAIIKTKINKVIYLSCNPATLGRDLQILIEHFDITKIQPFDMFPQTGHIETMVLLSLKESKR